MRREIIPGQFVTEDKRLFARQLRREMTAQEKRVWDAVRGPKLGGFKFRRQQVIDGYIADFYCDQVGVVLELDGQVHDSQAEYDAHRDQVIASRGLVVIRFPNDCIDRDLPAVLSDILRACQQRLG